MAKNMEVAIVLKTRDDGTIKILSATGKELKAVEKATKSTTRQAGLLGNAWGKMAGYAAAYIGIGFAKSLLSEADSVGKVSKKLGISTSALQEYRYAAKIAGVEIRTFDMATQRFTRRVGEAVKGTGEAKEALKTLGIQLTDNVGKTRKTEDMLLDVADALKSVTDPAERLRLAFKLFDSEGVAMVNMMTDGAEGLKKMREEAQRLGIVMSVETIASAEKATDQFTALADVFKVNMATGLASALKFLSPVIKGFIEISSKSETWIIAITGIGLAITAKLVPAIWSATTALWALATNPIVLGLTALAGALYGLGKAYHYFFGKSAGDKKITDLYGVDTSKLTKDQARLFAKFKQAELEYSQWQKAMAKNPNFNNEEGKIRLEKLKKQLQQARILVDNARIGINKMNGNPILLDAVKKTKKKKKETPIIKGGWKDGIEAMTKGFGSFKNIAFDVFAQVKQASINMAKGFEDAFVNSLMRGQFEFSSFANIVKGEFNRMLADMIRAQVRANITKPLFDAMAGALGGMFGGASKMTGRKDGGLSGDGYIGSTAGSARSDSQFIAVSGSEYIINARATAKHMPLLEQINNGTFKRFANGGAVSGGSSASGNSNLQVNVNVKDATGGAVNIKASKPIKRAGGGFDIELIAQAVTGINANKASRSEDPYQEVLASNAGLALDGGGLVMTVSYPTTLPIIPRTGATIKQVPAFEVFQTSAGIVNINRILKNPPLQYACKIKLIGQDQIALFDDWFVKDTLNGALRFTISLYLPVNSGGAVNCVCQFTAPPTFSEVGTHSNRIKEVTLSLYLYNPTHATVSTQAGTYPSIPAPITASVSESKTSLVMGGVQKYGKQSAVGVVQSADTYTLIILMNYAEFKAFDAWWSNQQADGTKSFTAPLLTNAGLQNMLVRPLNGWSAKCNAGDVEVSLQVELTRPPLQNTFENLGTEFSISTQDLQNLGTMADTAWRALKGN